MTTASTTTQTLYVTVRMAADLRAAGCSAEADDDATVIRMSDEWEAGVQRTAAAWGYTVETGTSVYDDPSDEWTRTPLPTGYDEDGYRVHVEGRAAEWEGDTLERQLWQAGHDATAR